MLSCGNKHDSPIGYSLLEKIENSIILADKTYNSKKIRAKLTENNSKLVSSSKKNALNPIDYDKYLYKECYIVECYFKKIRELRRIATRYDKLQLMYKIFLMIETLMIYLK